MRAYIIIRLVCHVLATAVLGHGYACVHNGEIDRTVCSIVCARVMLLCVMCECRVEEAAWCCHTPSATILAGVAPPKIHTPQSTPTMQPPTAPCDERRLQSAILSDYRHIPGNVLSCMAPVNSGCGSDLLMQGPSKREVIGFQSGAPTRCCL